MCVKQIQNLTIKQITYVCICFLLNKFICRYNGIEVFVSDWYSGVSANPYISFYLRANQSGEIEIEWVDDYNISTFANVNISVLDTDTNN